MWCMICVASERGKIRRKNKKKNVFLLLLYDQVFLYFFFLFCLLVCYFSLFPSIQKRIHSRQVNQTKREEESFSLLFYHKKAACFASLFSSLCRPCGKKAFFFSYNIFIMIYKLHKHIHTIFIHSFYIKLFPFVHIFFFLFILLPFYSCFVCWREREKKEKEDIIWEEKNNWLTEREKKTRILQLFSLLFFSRINFFSYAFALPYFLFFFCIQMNEYVCCFFFFNGKAGQKLFHKKRNIKLTLYTLHSLSLCIAISLVSSKVVVVITFFPFPPDSTFPSWWTVQRRDSLGMTWLWCKNNPSRHQHPSHHHHPHPHRDHIFSLHFFFISIYVFSHFPFTSTRLILCSYYITSPKQRTKTSCMHASTTHTWILDTTINQQQTLSHSTYFHHSLCFLHPHVTIFFSVFSSCSIHHPRPLISWSSSSSSSSSSCIACTDIIVLASFAGIIVLWVLNGGGGLYFSVHCTPHCKYIAYFAMLRRTKPTERRSAIIIVIIFIILVPWK